MHKVVKWKLAKSATYTVFNFSSVAINSLTAFVIIFGNGISTTSSHCTRGLGGTEAMGGEGEVASSSVSAVNPNLPVSLLPLIKLSSKELKSVLSVTDGNAD